MWVWGVWCHVVGWSVGAVVGVGGARSCCCLLVLLVCGWFNVCELSCGRLCEVRSMCVWCVLDVVIHSCSCSVASSNAMSSITNEGRPLSISLPPVAKVTAFFRVGLTALSFHPVLLWRLSRQAPSDWRNKLAFLLK